MTLKSIGVVRQLDPLGRVVLPVELRRRMHLDVKDLLEIDVDGDSIRLRRYIPNCLFCGETGQVTEYKGHVICAACLKGLRALPLPGAENGPAEAE